MQAAYVARLQQQAAQIKQLLKLLNTSNVNINSNSSSNSTNVTENAISRDRELQSSNYQESNLVSAAAPNVADPALCDEAAAPGGYESLWELSERTLTNITDLGGDSEVETTTEVEEDEDVSGDQEDLYENTGVFAHNFTMAVGKSSCKIANCLQKYFLIIYPLRLHKIL